MTPDRAEPQAEPSAERQAEPQALTGIRVVDLTTALAGAFATRLLAEAGADVVSVEPTAGDPARRAAPAGFASSHRSKRTVTADLDRADHRRALEDLLARADVVTHDLPRATALEWGYDVAALRERHPHLLVATVPAYPVGHPYEDVAGSDAHVLATTGAMDEQQGDREGPVWIRLPFPSWCAGYLLASGITARLVQRETGGVVAPVATSLLQGALTAAALYWQRWERLPAPLTRHTLPKLWPDAALSIFECADGRWVQLAGAVGGWIESPPVLEALAIRDLVDLSETGVTPANRATWNDVFRSHDSGWWVQQLSEHDVPVMVVRRLGECFPDEQALVNGYAVPVEDPELGPVLQAGPPLETSPGCAVRWPARPLPGPADPGGAPDRLLDAVPGWTPRPAPAGTDGSRPVPPPLAGYRVLDFGSMVAGPFGAQCLADLGADVVKVEPVSGDRGRGLTQFAGCHRGKRSLAVDLKDPRARSVVEDLVRGADVVLHNMRLGAAGRLGIDGPGLAAVNPRVVFSHISAYGPRGPMAEFPGYDPTAQAFTGWEHANAGEGRPPMWLRNSIFDVQAGLAACLGALLGLLHRERTGTAGHSATSLLAVGMTAASEVAVSPGTGEVTPVATLTADQTGLDAAHRIHRLADGWLLVDAADDEQARAATRWLTEVEGEPGRAHTVGSASAELTALGVRVAPVAEAQLDAFLDSPVNRALGLSRSLETVGYGRLDLVGGFWSLGEAPGTPAAETVPALGQHTVDVLRESGRDPDEVLALVTGGVVAAPGATPLVAH